MKKLKKINMLLDGKQKAKMVLLLLMMLFGALLETAGIALVVPVMTAVVNPESIANNTYHMGDIYNMFGMTSTLQFAEVCMIAIVVIFVLKDIYLFLEQKVLLRFIYKNQFETSNRMMINFMMRPYE